jgi:hypothetical protein
VASFNPTNGSAPAVAVTTLTNASADALVAPIPGEWLRLPAAAPGAAELRVDGVLAACADPGGAGCSFKFAPSASPSVTAFSPAVLTNASDQARDGFGLRLARPVCWVVPHSPAVWYCWGCAVLFVQAAFLKTGLLAAKEHLAAPSNLFPIPIPTLRS